MSGVVAAAVRELPTWGITDSRDRGRGILTLTELKKAGESYVPERLRVYALRIGWRATQAAELANLAHAINDGRLLRPGRGVYPLRAEAIDRWRAQAREDD